MIGNMLFQAFMEQHYPYDNIFWTALALLLFMGFITSVSLLLWFSWWWKALLIVSLATLIAFIVYRLRMRYILNEFLHNPDKKIR